MYPLMLAYRLQTYAPSSMGFHLGRDGRRHGESERAYQDALRLTAARPYMYLIVNDREGAHLSLLLPDAPKPTLDQLTEELRRDAGERSIASMEMTAAVLAKGDMNGQWSNSYWSQAGDALHLLTCDIDWDQYRGVISARWSEWGGTFAEDTYVDMLDVTMSCRCGEVEEVQFGLAPPSLAELIVTLSSGQLERLFEERR